MRQITTLLLACCLVLLAAGTLHARESVLVIGDSLSIPLGQQMEKYYSLHPEISYASHGKVSSGLARPDFFDWERVLNELAASRRPDVLVVMLGTNDYKPMAANAGSLSFSGDAWNREYARRVQRLIDIARHYNPDTSIYWVGAPVMGRPDLDSAVRHINRVIKAQVSRNRDCHFIDTRATLADSRGRYTQYASTSRGRIRLRAKDGVHVTGKGASMLADRCLQSMETTPAARTRLVADAKKPAVREAKVSQAPDRTADRAVALIAAAPTIVDSSYAIQESSWTDAAKAKRRAGQLASKGIATWVKRVNLGGKGVWHRVMIGSFQSLAQARQHKLALSQRYAISNTLVIRIG